MVHLKLFSAWFHQSYAALNYRMSVSPLRERPGWPQGSCSYPAMTHVCFMAIMHGLMPMAMSAWIPGEERQLSELKGTDMSPARNTIYRQPSCDEDKKATQLCDAVCQCRSPSPTRMTNVSSWSFLQSGKLR